MLSGSSSTKREQVLDAAIELLGTRGSRGLTHRGVDELASFPEGSTSNYFRTRDALVDGIVGRFVERDIKEWNDVAKNPAPATVDELVDGLTGFVLYSTSLGRTMSAARYALAVEAVSSDSVQAVLRAGREQLFAQAGRFLRNLPAISSVELAFLLNCLDGLIMHQVSLPEEGFDPRAQVERLVRAIMREGDVR